MNAAQTDNPFGGLSQALADLIDQGLKIGQDVMDSVGRLRLPDLTSSVRRLTPPKQCGCDIPPPCWEPKPLGELKSHVCPGGSATVRLVVTNCSMTPRSVQVAASGTGGDKVTITPSTATIGPMEQVTFTASLAVAADAAECQTHHALLWVQGCRLHFLRWTIEVRSRGGCACHEVCVQDCPDLVHHWYDHFYCARACPPPRLGQVANG